MKGECLADERQPQVDRNEWPYGNLMCKAAFLPAV